MNISDSLASDVTKRGLYLERFKKDELDRVLRELNRLEGELVGKLRVIDPASGKGTLYQQRRLTKLLGQTRESIRSAYTTVKRINAGDLTKLAGSEMYFALNSVNAQVGVDIATVTLSPEYLKSVSSSVLVNGAPSAKWWSKQALDLEDRFTRSMRTGMLMGETTDDLVRRVRGTRAGGFRDGLMATSRRNAEALVRTSVQTVANDARMATLAANRDVVKGIQWVATLDDRTTQICMALSGKVWTYNEDGTLKPLGHDKEYPGPTAHWNCRSSQVPVLKSWRELAQGRPIKTVDGGRTNIDALWEKEAKAVGLSGDAAKFSQAYKRASMDGGAAADISFSGWLKSQAPHTVNKLLGPGRAELWKQGKITLTDLVSKGAKPMKLDQLEDAWRMGTTYMAKLAKETQGLAADAAKIKLDAILAGESQAVQVLPPEVKAKAPQAKLAPKPKRPAGHIDNMTMSRAKWQKREGVPQKPFYTKSAAPEGEFKTMILNIRKTTPVAQESEGLATAVLESKKARAVALMKKFKPPKVGRAPKGGHSAFYQPWTRKTYYSKGSADFETLLHEWGHYLDDSLGKASLSTRFKAAMEKTRARWHKEFNAAYQAERSEVAAMGKTWTKSHENGVFYQLQDRRLARAGVEKNAKWERFEFTCTEDTTKAVTQRFGSGHTDEYFAGHGAPEVEAWTEALSAVLLDWKHYKALWPELVEEVQRVLSLIE